MIRWAIYARYSSDRQNPKSCGDQVRECRQRIESLGGTIAHIYSDEALSGAHEAQRPQYLALLAAMKAGRVDAVMAEDMDRMNRSLEASARLYSLAERDGIELWTLADGRITQLHTGLKGLMGELFLKQLADKTRRGVLAVARDNRIPGGNCYGYDVAGRGHRTINESRAAQVRRIYADYAAGLSPRAIAAALNREGLPSPRGSTWRVSTLIGNPKRLNGLLNNPIYAGRPVFNRQRFVKDPETGRRMAKPNAPETWIHQDMPSLRIVSEPLWQAVQARRAAVRTGPHLHHCRRPKTLLSGLVACEECGSPMAIANGYFRCTAHGNSGTCGNNRGVRAAKLEAWLMEALMVALDDEEIVGEYVRHLHVTVARLDAERAKRAVAGDRRRQEIDRKIARLMAAIEDGGASEAIGARLAELEAERATLVSPVNKEERKMNVRILPDAPRRFRAQIAGLAGILAGTAADGVRARNIVRGMVTRIGARRRDGKVWIEVDGDLGAMLAFAEHHPEGTSIVRCGNPHRTIDAIAIPLIRRAA